METRKTEVLQSAAIRLYTLPSLYAVAVFLKVIVVYHHLMSSLFDELHDPQSVQTHPRQTTGNASCTPISTPGRTARVRRVDSSVLVTWHYYLATHNECIGPTPLGSATTLLFSGPSFSWSLSTLNKLRLPAATEASGRWTVVSQPCQLSGNLPEDVDFLTDRSDQLLQVLITNRVTLANNQEVTTTVDRGAIVSRSVNLNTALSRSTLGRTSRNKHLKALGAVSDSADSTNILALTTAGDVFVWSDAVNVSPKLSVFPLVWSVAPAPCITQISCGVHHYGVITTRGEVWMGGSNAFGQLGILTLEMLETSVPVQLQLSKDIGPVNVIACGSGHTIIAAGERIYEFGHGHSCPAEVSMDHLDLPAAWTVISLAAGEDFSIAALKLHGSEEDLRVISWGHKPLDGELGHAAIQSPEVPQFVDIKEWVNQGMNHVLNLAAYQHSVALHLGSSLESTSDASLLNSSTVAPVTTLLVWGIIPGHYGSNVSVREWSELHHIRQQLAKLALTSTANISPSTCNPIASSQSRSPQRDSGTLSEEAQPGVTETLNAEHSWDVAVEVANVTLAKETLAVFFLAVAIPKVLSRSSGYSRNPGVPKLRLPTDTCTQNNTPLFVRSRVVRNTQAGFSSPAVSEFWNRWGKPFSAEDNVSLHSTALSTHDANAELATGCISKEAETVTNTWMPKVASQNAMDEDILETEHEPGLRGPANIAPFIGRTLHPKSSLTTTYATQHPQLPTANPGASGGSSLRHAFQPSVSSRRDVSQQEQPKVLKSSLSSEKKTQSGLALLWKKVMGASSVEDPQHESASSASLPPTNEVVNKLEVALPRIVGEEWDARTRRRWESIVTEFESFREYSRQFWETYIFQQQFGIPKQDASTELRTLRSMYLRLHNDFLSILPRPEALSCLLPFDRSLHTKSAGAPEPSSANKPLAGRRASVMRNVLVYRWGNLRSASTDAQVDRSDSTVQTAKFSDSDNGISTNRLRQLRREVYLDITKRFFLKSDIDLRPDEDVPYQPWEIDASELNGLTKTSAVTSLFPPTGRTQHIYFGVYRGTRVALKVTEVSTSDNLVLRRRLREIFLHSTLRHPNIVTFMGAVIRGPQLILVLEGTHRGNLFQLLHESAFELTERDKIRLATDIATALNYLHRSGPLIHRDVKSANILIMGGDWKGRGLTAKLCDFEHARYLPDGIPRNTQHSSLTRRFLLHSLGVMPFRKAGPQQLPLQSKSYSSLESSSISQDASLSFIFGNTLSCDRKAPVYNTASSALNKTFDATGSSKGSQKCLEVSLQGLTGNVGTVQWMAPEVVSLQDNTFYEMQSTQRLPSSLGLGSRTTGQLTRSYTEKCDVYSYGMVLWELCYRTPPYLGLSDTQVMAYLSQGIIQLPIDSGRTPASAIALLVSCLRTDPSRRPDMSNLLDGLRAWECIVEIESTGPTVDVLHAVRDIVTDLFAHVGQETALEH